MDVTTGYHDASACAAPQWRPVWVAWCKVDGQYADTAELDSDTEAAAWCAQQRTARGAQ